MPTYLPPLEMGTGERRLTVDVTSVVGGWQVVVTDRNGTSVSDVRTTELGQAITKSMQNIVEWRKKQATDKDSALSDRQMAKLFGSE